MFNLVGIARTRRRHLAAALGSVLFVLGFFAAAAPAATPLLGIGVGSDAPLYDIDPATGAASNPRPTGLRIVAGITFGPGGALYGLTTGVSSPANSLVRIDPSTGAVTAVGPTGLPYVFEGDVRYNPATGLLYGLTDAPAAPAGPRRVFALDAATGRATVVGDLGERGDFSGLAFSPDGIAYVFDTNGYLLTYHPDWTLRTQVALSRSRPHDPIGIAGGLDFDPQTGLLYLTDGFSGTNLSYTVDTTTGLMTRVGPVGPLAPDGLAGIAFVPEPSAAAPLLVAAAMFLRRRRENRG